MAHDFARWRYLAALIGGFADALRLERYALYIFDYGSPVGLRLAMAHPDRVSAIISQNGNAYLEGLSEAWAPWRAYWASPTPEHRAACRASLDPDAIRTGQYLHGAIATLVSPDGYILDNAYMARPGADDIQLDLILDYASNLALYPAFQAIFARTRRRCRPYGAATILISCRPAPSPTAATCLMPK